MIPFWRRDVRPQEPVVDRTGFIRRTVYEGNIPGAIDKTIDEITLEFINGDTRRIVRRDTNHFRVSSINEYVLDDGCRLRTVDSNGLVNVEATGPKEFIDEFSIYLTTALKPKSGFGR